MESALNSKYIDPTRPYSQLELKDMQKKIYNDLYLGEVYIYHKECKHAYFPKKNSKKYKENKKTYECDIGNCSVCWKLSKMPEDLYDKASRLVEQYHKYLNSDRKDLTYDTIDMETVYYKWLYERI